MRFIEYGPYLDSISRYAGDVFFRGPQRIEANKFLPVEDFARRLAEHRNAKQLWLPGDFMQTGPMSIVIDEDAPYIGLATNKETGTLLDDWMVLMYPMLRRSPALRSWRLRRIADTAWVLRHIASSARRAPFESGGKLRRGQEALLGVTVTERSNGDRWTCMYRRTDTDTKPIAFTGYATAGLLLGSLQERIGRVLAKGVPAGISPSLLRLRCLSTNPCFWARSELKLLDSVEAELLGIESLNPSSVVREEPSDATKQLLDRMAHHVAETIARVFGGDDADAKPNGQRRKFPSGNDDDYRPATWFPKGMAGRLRQAASKKRKTKRVSTRKVDGVVCYSVADCRRWWPKDVPK
jgi:hypothetical protein